MVAKDHINAMAARQEAEEDLDEVRPIAQSQIDREQLVGSTYGKDKLDSVHISCKIALKGNWPTRSIEDNKVY